MSMITLGRHGPKSVVKFGILAAMIASPAVSRASTVYSTFGPSFGDETGVADQVGPDGFGDNIAQAATFTPGSTLDLSSLEIALSCFNTGDCPDNFKVEVTADSSGLPNTSDVLASFTVAGSTLPILGASSHLTLTYSGPTLALNSGTPYWVVVLPDATATDQIQWNLTPGSDISTAVAFGGGGPGDTWFSASETAGAFEVDGNNPGGGGGVPEPGTLGMMLGGGLLIGLVRKIRG